MTERMSRGPPTSETLETLANVPGVSWSGFPANCSPSRIESNNQLLVDAPPANRLGIELHDVLVDPAEAIGVEIAPVVLFPHEILGQFPAGELRRLNMRSEPKHQRLPVGFSNCLAGESHSTGGTSHRSDVSPKGGSVRIRSAWGNE